MCIRDSIWTSLTIQGKVGILQIIANLERSVLGVSNESNVCATNLEEEGLLGRYDDSTQEIIIDMDLLLNGTAKTHCGVWFMRHFIPLSIVC